MPEELTGNITGEPPEKYTSRKDVEDSRVRKKNKRESKPNKKNDMIYKGAFEDYFVHLLRFIYPNADQIFDMDRGIR